VHKQKKQIVKEKNLLKNIELPPQPRESNSYNAPRESTTKPRGDSNFSADSDLDNLLKTLGGGNSNENRVSAQLTPPRESNSFLPPQPPRDSYKPPRDSSSFNPPRESLPPQRGTRPQSMAILAEGAKPQRASVMASASELDALITSIAEQENNDNSTPTGLGRPPSTQAPLAPPSKPYTPPQRPVSTISGKNYSDDEIETLRKNLGNVRGGRHTCQGCGGTINGEIVTSNGRTYHPDHFTCGSCRSTIGAKSFYEMDGRPVCDRCYTSKYLPKCQACSGGINGSCLIAMGRKYHAEHFTCQRCGNRFPDGSFYEKDDRAYCEHDYFELFGERCSACNGTIRGECVSALNRKYHSEHFVCSYCQVQLGSTFYELSGKPYCQTHYHQLSGNICPNCNRPITGKCVSALDKKWHPEHFTCTFCSTQLSGAFNESNGKPYCKSCSQKLFGN